MESKLQRATYIGSMPHLVGKTARLMEDCESRSRGVLAQFNDVSLKEAFGWHSFYAYEFHVDAEEGAEEGE